MGAEDGHQGDTQEGALVKDSALEKARESASIQESRFQDIGQEAGAIGKADCRQDC